MAMKQRVVVVGTGSIGRRHARLLAERPDVQVELCDPSPEMLALAHQEVGPLASYTTYNEALESAPGVMVIATPPEWHCEQTVRALERGIHVLCEKPVSGELAAARQMQQAAKAATSVLSIGFNLHFHPALLRLKELVDSGTLGTPLQVTYRLGSYITLVNSRSRYQANLRGALLLDYAHQPDMICWLLGARPRGVYMAAAQGGSLDLTSNPNFLSIVCDYDRPLLTAIHLNYVQMPQQSDCLVTGDRGWALLDIERGMLRIGSQPSGQETSETIHSERDNMYRAEHQRFLDAVAGRCGPSSPIDEAIVSMEIIDAGMRSWDTQQRVVMGES
jgi:predicted dehydrogenase